MTPSFLQTPGTKTTRISTTEGKIQAIEDSFYLQSSFHTYMPAMDPIPGVDCNRKYQSVESKQNHYSRRGDVGRASCRNTRFDVAKALGLHHPTRMCRPSRHARPQRKRALKIAG